MKSKTINKIKYCTLPLILFAIIGGVLFTTISPQTVSAQATSCTKSFLGFPSPFRGLTNASCDVKSPTEVGGLSPFIWTIAINIIDMALMAVTYIAVFFILYGGFSFIVNSGNADVIAKSRKTIFNAVIGLVISIAAMAIVNKVSGIM